MLPGNNRDENRWLVMATFCSQLAHYSPQRLNVRSNLNQFLCLLSKEGETRIRDDL